MEKITLNYCRRLLDEHWVGVSGGMNDGAEMNSDILKGILKKSGPDSRFRVSYDDQNNDDEGTWDVMGPGIPYGTLWCEERCDAEAVRDALNRILRAHFGPSTRRVDYTPEAHAAKSVLEGDCCPACGSNDLNLEEYRHANATIVILRSCNDCNSEWEELHALQGYRNLKAD